MALISGSQRLDDPYPRPTGPHVVVSNDETPPEQDTGVTFEDGAVKIEQPDGSIIIDFEGGDDSDAASDGFFGNLSSRIGDSELEQIASDLLEGIQRDEDSRKEWLETRALGITLLGLKLEKPRSDMGS